MKPRCTQPHGGTKRLVRVGRFWECQGCGGFVPARVDAAWAALELMASGRQTPAEMVALARATLMAR
jgi:hypothetical protein